jgi:peroxiredoxin Q/BCP
MSGRTLLFVALAAAAVAGCENATRESAEPQPQSMTIDRAFAVIEEAASEASPAVGRAAPGFTLTDQHGEKVTVADRPGRWVVIYFYPKDDTPACTAQAIDFSLLSPKFREAGADVFGISEDSPESHRAFAEKFDLHIPLLSDPRHEVMRKYGAWVEARMGGETYGRAIRSTFLIGPGGTVRHHWPEVMPRGHAERVLDKVEEMQAQEPTD